MTSYFNQKNIGSIQLGLRSSTNTINQSSRRLSSGQRINSASDDSASLNLASKLENEARLNSQGIRNISDGVSVANVAFSAIDELMQITSRISELATQASNSVYSSDQRNVLDLEAQALVSEYSRVAASTSFNGDALFAEDKTINIFFGSQSETEILEIGNLLGTTTTTGGGGGGGGTSEVTTVQYTAGIQPPAAPGPGASFRLYTGSTDYYFWLYNGSTTDPGLSGTGVQIDVSALSTGAQYASATQAAIHATTGFSATVLGETVTVTNDDSGNVTDGTNVNVSGLTVTTTVQGTGGGGGGGGSTTEHSTTIDGIDLSSQSAAQSSIDIATAKIDSLSVANGKLNANISVLNSNYNRYSQNEANLTEAVNKITSVDVASETVSLVEGQIRQQSVLEITKTNNLQSESVLSLLG